MSADCSVIGVDGVSDSLSDGSAMDCVERDEAESRLLLVICRASALRCGRGRLSWDSSRLELSGRDAPEAGTRMRGRLGKVAMLLEG